MSICCLLAICVFITYALDIRHTFANCANDDLSEQKANTSVFFCAYCDSIVLFNHTFCFLKIIMNNGNDVFEKNSVSLLRDLFDRR